MNRIGILAVAALMSTAAMTTLAQAQASEPAAFQSQNPNRDVLNGGQLTPAGRAALGQYEGPSGAYAAQAPEPPVVRSHRRHRQ
jgi:hypothetical protein